VLVLFALTVIASWLWGQMLQPTCREVPRPDLSLQEMVDVKLKVDDAEREGSAPFRLSGREASFMLRDVLRLPMHVELDDGEVHLKASLPYHDDCYNIDYVGGALLEDGVAHLHPTRFQIGDLDVSSWVDGATEVSTLGWISPEAVELLAHVESLRIENDQVVIDVDDVRALR